jgi:hypothetical protein
MMRQPIRHQLPDVASLPAASRDPSGKKREQVRVSKM